MDNFSKPKNIKILSNSGIELSNLNGNIIIRDHQVNKNVKISCNIIQNNHNNYSGTILFDINIKKKKFFFLFGFI